MIQNFVIVGQPITAGANGPMTFAYCQGDPSIYALDANAYAVGCFLLEQDASTNFDILVWRNDGTVAVPSWTLVNRVDSAGVLLATTTIASADVLALNSSPIELVPAPAMGKAIQVVSVMGKMAFLTAAYATHTELDIVDTVSGSVLFKDTGTLLAATGNIVATVPANVNSNAGLEVTEAGSVSATVATGDPITGAGDLTIYTLYKVVTL